MSNFHIVDAGDTLTKIARQYGMHLCIGWPFGWVTVS